MTLTTEYIVKNSCALLYIGVGTGEGGGGHCAMCPQKFHGVARPPYTYRCIAISTKPSIVAMSAPPLIKKL